jgi:hypothetical protein
MHAHLATITSSEEDVFVHELGREFHSYYGIRSFWVGGVQNVNSPAFKEPGGGWEWVNSEETITTKTHSNTELYSNWAPKVPNDLRNQPQNPDHLPENHMTVGQRDTSLADDMGKATGWNDEFKGPYIWGYIVEVEAESTVIYKNCDSKVDNLRLPPVRKECPPGQISSLIEGCAKYNDEPVLDGSIMHIISELKSAGLINKEERNSRRSCIS